MTLFNFGADDPSLPRRMMLLSLPVIAGGVAMRIAAGWWLPRVGIDPSTVGIIELAFMGLTGIGTLIFLLNLASIMAIRMRETLEALRGNANQADG